MTRSPVEFKDSTMIGGILQILNIHYGSPIDEYVLLWCMMVSLLVFLNRTQNVNVLFKKKLGKLQPQNK